MNGNTPETVASTRRPGLLINRAFGLLWIGGAISVIGDLIFDTTLVMWITLQLARQPDGTPQPWTALAITGLLVAVSLPTFLFGPLAGVFVDRWDKRRTMLAMDALRALFAALLILATNILPLPFVPGGRLTTTEQLITVYACVVLAAIASQFFTPARIAMIGDVVPEAYRAQASGLTQTVSNLALLIGPGVAPILYVLVGPTWAITFNALSFLFSYLMLSLIRVPRTARAAEEHAPRGHFFREFADGVRQTFSNRVTSTLLVVLVLIMFGAGPLNALDILFALGTLHAPVALYGLLAVAMGITAVAGAILGSWLAPRIGLVRTFLFALLGAGVGIVIYSRMTSFWQSPAPRRRTRGMGQHQRGQQRRPTLQLIMLEIRDITDPRDQCLLIVNRQQLLGHGHDFAQLRQDVAVLGGRQIGQCQVAIEQLLITAQNAQLNLGRLDR